MFFNTHPTGAGFLQQDSQPICAALVTQTIQLNAGWTWISLNVVAEDMTLFTEDNNQGLFPGFPAESHLKTQVDDFADVYEGYGWYGQLTTLNTRTMYKIKTTVARSVTITGTPVQLPMEISLVSGLSATTRDRILWVPYPLQTTAPIGDALEYVDDDGNNALVAGDTIKGQMSGTAEYYGEEYGWWGPLTTLQPGQGYKIQVQNIGTLRWVDVA